MHPGGLKEINFNDLQAKDATEPLRKAISGMLPKNKLRQVRMDRLKIFEGSEHPYGANIIIQHGVKKD